MRTYFDCYSCFVRQALDACRTSGVDDETTRDILVEVGAGFASFPIDATPPVMAGTIRDLLYRRTQIADPYYDIKRRSTELALALYPELRSRIDRSEDRLRTAVVLAIVGNIIDYGVGNGEEIESRLDALLEAELSAAARESSRLFAVGELTERLVTAETLLYIGDNAGETVFDRLLIEELTHSHPQLSVVYAVHDAPILNDALDADARDAGIAEGAQIVSSGSRVPGTILAETNLPFRERFESADVVLCKGQGNYETLSDEHRDVFFLLMAKCPVVARDVGCAVGDVLLIHNSRPSPG